MTMAAAALLAPAPGDSDTSLAAWRDAAEAGALPAASSARWQPLRAGVVNLWEFDVAEYWFAGGRAQLVGQNQSGKSTLMALTTLIMLAGDLDRKYVDTFGDQQKSFRYYVEPTDDPKDRRDADGSTYRGWAWVEYGRIDEAGTPRYFTTLLYAQSKRGANDFTKKWAVCASATDRVRGGIELAQGNAAAAVGDVAAAVPEFRIAGSGAEYTAWQARELFGFTDTARMEVVVRMLKVLRTPHLGQKLDPDFLTNQMREALPAIDREEIDELAEGWDQLDRLAADKDNAVSALAALTAFTNRAWAPWADALIRRHADSLAAATTVLDDVTRDDRKAREDLTQATDAVTETADEHVAAVNDHADAALRHDEYLRSAAFRDASSAAARIDGLESAARSSASAAVDDHRAQKRAEDSTAKTQRKSDEAANAATEAASNAAARGAETRAALVGTALSDTATAWIDSADAARVTAACRQQKTHISEVRNLLRGAERADAALHVAETRLDLADGERRRRDQARDQAQVDVETALQRLSDELETWASRTAAELGDARAQHPFTAPDAATGANIGPTDLDQDATAPVGPPPASLRLEWLNAVTATAASDKPRMVLTGRLRSDWLTPALTPLTDSAARAQQSADRLAAEAAKAEKEADAEQARPEPSPEPPTLWTRRQRPPAGPGGAPLWRLLDPAGGVGSAVLDTVEAALDACGLLDAWVTPDGAWVEGCDGDETVLTVNFAAHDGAVSAPAGATLAAVLRVSDDAAELTAPAYALLTRVAWHPTAADSELPGESRGELDAPAGYAIADDGRWRTPATAGRAGRATHGAELIGTAARATARQRRVELLRARAAQWRAHSQALAGRGAALREYAQLLSGTEKSAPDDGPVVSAAHARATARTEQLRAQAAFDAAHAAHRDAATTRDNAHAALMQTAAAHSLPHTTEGLDGHTSRLDALLHAVGVWDKALDRAAAAAATLEREQDRLAEAQAVEDSARTRATVSQDKADVDASRLEAAREALSLQHSDALTREHELKGDKERLAVRAEQLRSTLADLQTAVARAEDHQKLSAARRDTAELERDRAVVDWWRLVDTGLPELRKLELPATRSVRNALDMARAAREQLRPRSWTSVTDVAAKDRAVADAWTSLVTRHLPELRAVLEASGGRTVTTATREETGSIEAVLVRVDSTTDATDPVTASARLERQIADLSSRHDEKMNLVLVELLSSAFVEHLRDRLASVIALLEKVNRVLAAHPTGATRTVLRLRRVPAEGQKQGHEVLEALSGPVLGQSAVQEQVRSFLKQQILEAQDRGRDSAVDWKDHLAELLDYRTWFAVVTEYRVADSDDRWHPLTKQVHGTDSGGGKVVTLLQPLLATLVALYDESPNAPRPLWLDEAFTGVDAANRSTMLDLVVSFDLDFLLAGPDALATVAHVPSVAIWNVNRAPANLSGVDLSLTLWAGNTRYMLTVPDYTQPAGASPPVNRHRPA